MMNGHGILKAVDGRELGPVEFKINGQRGFIWADAAVIGLGYDIPELVIDWPAKRMRIPCFIQAPGFEGRADITLRSAPQPYG